MTLDKMSREVNDTFKDSTQIWPMLVPKEVAIATTFNFGLSIKFQNI